MPRTPGCTSWALETLLAFDLAQGRLSRSLPLQGSESLQGVPQRSLQWVRQARWPGVWIATLSSTPVQEPTGSVSGLGQGSGPPLKGPSATLVPSGGSSTLQKSTRQWSESVIRLQTPVATPFQGTPSCSSRLVLPYLACADGERTGSIRGQSLCPTGMLNVAVLMPAPVVVVLLGYRVFVGQREVTRVASI